MVARQRKDTVANEWLEDGSMTNLKGGIDQGGRIAVDEAQNCVHLPYARSVAEHPIELSVVLAHPVSNKSV